MKRILTYAVPAALAVAVIGGVAFQSACNNVGDCPATITPGGDCSGDNLECPYVLDSPSPACDGTNIEGGIQTACICTSGTWVCPDPFSCDTGDGGGDETTTDDGGDASVDDTGPGDDGSAEAASDAADDSASSSDAADAADAKTD